jgi:peptide/nickel transport system permease protein
MLKILWADRFARLGLICLAIFVILAVLAPWVGIYAPNQIDLIAESQPPSSTHFFGTDELGRDIWSRAWHGARISLTVGFVAVSLSILVGTLVGALAGFFGGRLDSFLMRTVDVLLSLPTIFLILTIQALLKPSIWNVMVVIGLTSWMGVARLVRAEFLKIKKQTFVLAKRAYGFSNVHLIFKTILPNAAGPLIVAATLGMAGAVMTESVLSFLGMGVQLPQASWGNMLQNAQESMLDAPWQSVVPGVLIFLTVLSLNFVGDAVRRYWNIKER